MKASNFLYITFLLGTSIVISSCKKDCTPTNSVCTETPPKNELCLAFFKRWFYNKDKNKCEEISYSGCNQKGFATEKECEECKCK